jgi:glycosyltransferase involved in cell wall biosynthesis
MPTLIEAPLLSIVVPIRNMQGRLGLVRNWLTQVQKLNMEVIFVNDASIDDTLTELNEIVGQNKYNFVKTFDGIFGGPGPARNFGMSKAKGKWIAFWDSDDEPDAPMFFEMIRLAELGGQDIAVGGWAARQALGEEGKPSNLEKIHSSKLINILVNPGIWRWAFKVEIAKKSKFPATLMGEDVVFLANLKLSPRFQYNKKVYTYLQGTPGQLTSNESALRDRRKMGRYLRREIPRHELSLLIVLLRVKIKVSSFWHGVRNG